MKLIKRGCQLAASFLHVLFDMVCFFTRQTSSYNAVNQPVSLRCAGKSRR
jgi:hypothetical protein